MTIVVGYVPKPEGEAAVREAAREAARRGERVYLVNSASGDAPVDRSFASPEDLEWVGKVFENAGVAYEVDQSVGARDGAESVLQAAKAHNASLIVIGMRRRSTTGKFLFGSTAQRILLEATAPVLAVKGGPEAS